MPGHKVAREAFRNRELYEKYSCLSCSHLLRDAVQSAMCGHWFCETCISGLLKTRNPVCPNCKDSLKSEGDTEDGSPGYFQDKFVRRDIDALEMVCIYQNKGCEWEGTFGKLQGHMTNCEYSVCGECQQKLTTLPDDHKCKVSSLRGESGGFYCPLKKVGCTAGKFESEEELQSHVKNSEIRHSELLVQSITTISTTLEEDRGTHLVSNPPRQYTNVEADGRMDSGYGSNHFGVEATERDNTVKKSPRTGRASPQTNGASGIGTLSSDSPKAMTAGKQAQMQNESVRKMKQELEMVRRDMKTKDEELASLRAMVNKLEKTQRSKNADFEDRDFRLSLIENSNYDGTMVWKIPQFSQRMSDAQSGKYTSIFSLPFYTGRYGFKMCLRLYILGDGIGKGGHMSLFFVLMKGEFDNILQWPFSHKVTFKLINQGTGKDVVDTFQPDPMSTSFRKPRSDMNIASGCPRFVSHEELKTGGFIVDDTVFIKCLVDTNNVRHP